MAVSPQMLQQVSDLLLSAIPNPNDPNAMETQRRVNETLRNYGGDPSFNLCLLELTIGSTDPQAQHLAATTLKQNIEKRCDSAIKPNLDVTKQKLVQPLVQGNCPDFVRRAVGACISELAKTGNWPTLVHELWPQLQQSQNPATRIGVLTCVADMCEYCTGQLEAAAAGQAPPAAVLIPGLVQMIAGSNTPDEVLLGAQACFSLLENQNSDESTVIFDGFKAVLPQVLQALERCESLKGTAQGTRITEAALRVYRALLWYYEDLKAAGKIQGILQLVYSMSTVRNDQIALAAVEFWQDLAGMADAVADVASGGLLKELTKLLLDKLVLSEEEISFITDEENSDNVVPRNRGKKKKGGDDDDGEVEQWTVRKCATLTLDAISRKENLVSPPNAPGWLLQAEIFPRLQHQDWKVQEAAIMAFGAISEGCFAEIRDHLPRVFPQLVQVMKNSALPFLLRTATFLALGRRGVMTWICQNKETFDVYLFAILDSMYAKERKVQEAAVSCFLSLLEYQSYMDGGFLTTDPMYFEGLLERIGRGLKPESRYTSLNLLILMESIDAFAACFGSRLASPQAETHLIKPLIQHFMNLPPEDTLLLPRFLMTLANLAQYLEEAFLGYAPPLFQRALAILGRYFEVHLGVKKGQIQEKDAPDLGENPKYATELVSALFEYVATSDTAKQQLRQLLLTEKYAGTGMGFLEFVSLPFSQPSLEVTDTAVLQAFVTFFGDELKTLADVLLDPLLGIKDAIFSHLTGEGELPGTVAWFAAELVMTTESSGRPPQQVQQVCQEVLQKLMPILCQKKGAWFDSLQQNAAVTIGRIALVQPDLLVRELASFFHPLCSCLAECDDEEWDDLKMQAFLGVQRLTQVNIAVLGDGANRKAYAKAVNSFKSIADLHELCQEVIATVKILKQNCGANWGQVLKEVKFPAAVLGGLGQGFR
eukprot:TRINITY_DN24575_c0_g1_i1.p1 TRINITY_DN24575_c0_g1~~TRINITY_DN24575_c0_g1_i1.p1  ORF type:complete len:960 (+),score=443.29 TRINITY_DN24575_c0_g1_i1:74-2881(+)